MIPAKYTIEVTKDGYTRTLFDDGGKVISKHEMRLTETGARATTPGGLCDKIEEDFPDLCDLIDENDLLEIASELALIG